ncbi:uncharacterized protein LOC122419715 isoform X2 [Cervus canadensis]|uniref:uncharacterized protein LOC122419715 isoform X2 n=1 Tax=Cervus canadensis TaxID=1574408 RepID=UPI001C9E3160|nr:uncharacterized protein LOC122419715 isoform X2 [Cervus canadensis]
MHYRGAGLGLPADSSFTLATPIRHPDPAQTPHGSITQGVGRVQGPWKDCKISQGRSFFCHVPCCAHSPGFQARTRVQERAAPQSPLMNHAEGTQAPAGRRTHPACLTQEAGGGPCTPPPHHHLKDPDCSPGGQSCRIRTGLHMDPGEDHVGPGEINLRPVTMPCPTK